MTVVEIAPPSRMIASGTGLESMQEAKRTHLPDRCEVADALCAWCCTEQGIEKVYDWWIEEYRGERVLWMISYGGICKWHHEIEIRRYRERMKVTKEEKDVMTMSACNPASE